VIILVLLVGGGVGYFVILPKIQQISPNSTLQTFCDGYKNLNASEVYGTLSTSAQAQNSENSITQAFALIKGLGATVTSCTVSNVQVSGSTATATITIVVSALGQTQSQAEPVDLVLQNGSWKINALPQSSQP
jgi:hypothetical protein